MLQTIIPNFFIDLAMGTLLYASIALFHCATSQVFVVGISFNLYNRDLFRWLSEEPYNIIGYVTPVVVHYALAALITAAVSSQISILDVFIISTVAVAVEILRQIIELKRIRSDRKNLWANRFSNQEDLDEFLRKTSSLVDEIWNKNGLLYYINEIIELLILISGGLTGILVTTWFM
jgi:hypothetical protein